MPLLDAPVADRGVVAEHAHLAAACARGSPRGSRRWWSCRRRSGRAARTPRRARPRTTGRAPRPAGRTTCAGRGPRSPARHGQTPAPAPPRPSPPAKRAAPAPRGLERGGAALAPRASSPSSKRHADALDRGAAVGQHRVLRERRERLGVSRARGPGGRPSGTISFTRPIACASSASTIRPLRIRSSARPEPDDRAAAAGCRRPPAARPSAARGSRARRRSVAIRRSHHSASSSPPARHQPEIAAIVGLDGVSRVKPSGPPSQLHARPEALDALQVGAGAEGDAAGAGEDHHARVVVGLEALR